MEVICFVGLFALLFFLVEDLVCGRPSPVHLNEETDRLLTVSKHRKQKMEDEVICSVSLFALVCLCLEDLLFSSCCSYLKKTVFGSMGSRRWK